MAKYIGQCSKCGSGDHPKGNVFRIMSSLYYSIDFPSAPEPTTETVKVCNNCNTPHPFHRRMSAKKNATAALFDRLFAEMED